MFFKSWLKQSTARLTLNINRRICRPLVVGYGAAMNLYGPWTECEKWGIIGYCCRTAYHSTCKKYAVPRKAIAFRTGEITRLRTGFYCWGVYREGRCGEGRG